MAPGANGIRSGSESLKPRVCYNIYSYFIYVFFFPLAPLVSGLLICVALVACCDRPVVLTKSRSSGRFPPLLMPLFMEMKRSRVVLSFTQGLWRLVLSMMMANDRM